jgi:DivIVA domain-containing protein
VNSIRNSGTDLPTTFRRSWRGYDPDQVEEFIRQTASERQRHQEGLARLEALMASYGQGGRDAMIAAARHEAAEILAKARSEADRLLSEAAGRARRLQGERGVNDQGELDRLTKLRFEVANCLETSLAALRTATDLLSSGPAEAQALTPVREAAAQAPSRAPTAWSLNPRHQKPAGPRPRAKWALQLPRWTSGTRVYGTAAAALAALFVVAAATGYLAAPDDAPVPSAAAASTSGAVADVRPQATAPAGPADLSQPNAAAQPEMNGLVLTLTARRSCWIATVIDGGQRLERLLKQDETIIVRADEEVVLRAGDAGALSVLINNRLTRPLGGAGQVVTTRITRANAPNFLL